MQSHYRVVIVGGGVVGASVLYHLAKLGWTDVAPVEREKNTAPQRLVTLEVDALDADASGYEPVWKDGRRVGFVTSGGYGHHVGKSLAMALVDVEHAQIGEEFHTHVVGVERGARIIASNPYDPGGAVMRR